MNTTVKPASDKQIAFLESLRASRTPSVSADAVREWAQQASSKAVSEKIDWLKRQPIVTGPISSNAQVAQQQAKQPEPEDGIYVVKGDDPVAYSYVDRQDLVPFKEDQIFKVYKMVHGSGRQGVKRLVVDKASKTGSFEYVGLAAKHLPKDAVLMPLDEAKAFGKIYGFCVRCGRTLTDDDSIAAGIGPVCAGKWA